MPVPSSPVMEWVLGVQVQGCGLGVVGCVGVLLGWLVMG